MGRVSKVLMWIKTTPVTFLIVDQSIQDCVTTSPSGVSVVFNTLYRLTLFCSFLELPVFAKKCCGIAKFKSNF